MLIYKPVRVVDLSPRWCGQPRLDLSFSYVDDIQDAYGLLLVCPLCYINKGYTDIGVERLLLWQPSVPKEIFIDSKVFSFFVESGRWHFSGTGFDDLTLINGSSSILLLGEGCNAHFWIRNGQIEWA